MSCQHDLIVKDGFSDTNSFKISECKICGEIIKVILKGEKPKEASVWDAKDLRITRMSVLKTASEIAIHCADFSENTKDKLIALVLEIGKELETWVYRREQ